MSFNMLMKHYNLHIMKMGQSAPIVTSTIVFIVIILNHASLREIVKNNNVLITLCFSYAYLRTMTAGSESSGSANISLSARNPLPLHPVSQSSHRQWTIAKQMQLNRLS